LIAPPNTRLRIPDITGIQQQIQTVNTTRWVLYFIHKLILI
jgi:hypothetical protein